MEFFGYTGIVVIFPSFRLVFLSNSSVLLLFHLNICLVVLFLLIIWFILKNFRKIQYCWRKPLLNIIIGLNMLFWIFVLILSISSGRRYVIDRGNLCTLHNFVIIYIICLILVIVSILWDPLKCFEIPVSFL